MPGEPVETFLGVTAMGLGVLVVYSAVKNVSPVAVIKQTIATGSLADLSKLPKLLDTPGKDSTDLNNTLPPGDPALPANAGRPPKCASGFTPRYDLKSKHWRCIGDVPVPGGPPIVGVPTSGVIQT